jgi:hypothetical protein
MRQEKHNKTAPGGAAGSADGGQAAGVTSRREVSSAHSSREATKPSWSIGSTADAVQPWTASDTEPAQQQQQLQQQVLGVEPVLATQPVVMPTYARGSSHGGSSRDAAELQRTGSSSSSSSDNDSSDSCAANALGMPRAPFAPQPPSSSRPAAVAAAPRRLQVAGQALAVKLQ